MALPPRPPAGMRSRPTSQTPRGVLQVDWAFFGELCRVLALKIFREYDPDVVIGIAKAGVIPGAVVASILQRDFASIAITPEGSVIAGPPHLVLRRRLSRPPARDRDGQRGSGRVRPRAQQGVRLGDRLVHVAGRATRHGPACQRAVASGPPR